MCYFLWHHFYWQYYQQAICYCMPCKWQIARWHVGGCEKKGKQTNQYSNQYSAEMYTMTHKMLRVPLTNHVSFGTIRSTYKVGALGWPGLPQSWRSGKWWGIIRETNVSSRKSRMALAVWPGMKSSSVTLTLLICAPLPPQPKNYFLFDSQPAFILYPSKLRPIQLWRCRYSIPGNCSSFSELPSLQVKSLICPW
jgi:hypothetical protein